MKFDKRMAKINKNIKRLKKTVKSLEKIDDGDGGWSYRVVRQVVDGEVRYGIHEFFPGSGKGGWTASPVAIYEETVEELCETLRHVLAALDQPVIEDDEIMKGWAGKSAELERLSAEIEAKRRRRPGRR